MKPSPGPGGKARHARFEHFEERIVLSGQPLDQFWNELTDGLDLAAQYSEVAPDLAVMDTQSEIAALRNQFGFDGAGQTVAVIDSGIAYDHYALGGGFGAGYRVVGGWDFAENDANPYDDGPFGFHGTHVSGIVGSSDSQYQGVASGVDLVALRVFDDYGNGSFSYVEQALRWVHENQDTFENPITTVNLSLGTDWNSHSVPNWSMLEDEFKLLEEDGIFISVAAGNSFQKYGTPGLSYPASSPFVVPVASVGADGQLSDFSQRSQEVLAAPGERVMSTVPDHLFGSSAPSHRFLQASGTSMAAPYVAGASTLVRQAMDFLGYQDVDQDQIEAHFRHTADVVYDAVTQANYYRLNLSKALDSLMADDFGDVAADAEDLGTWSESAHFTGVITRVGDQDVFSFVAGQTGRVTMQWDQTHALDAEWSLDGVELTNEGQTVSFEVQQGEVYTLAVKSNEGLGHYTVDAVLEADDVVEDVYVELGTIAAQQFDHLAVNGTTWFGFQAGQTGRLTLELLSEFNAQGLQVELFDADQQTLDLGQAGRFDVDLLQGEKVWLKVVGQTDSLSLRATNLIRLSNGVLSIGGTAGNDAIRVETQQGVHVELLGTHYEFATDEVKQIVIDGRGGEDTLMLSSGSTSDTVRMRVGEVDLQNAQHSIRGAGFANIDVDAGAGQDRLYLYDSAGDDRFSASASSATMSGVGFVNRAKGIESVYAYSSQGHDVAALEGTAGNDRFFARSSYSALSSQSLSWYAMGFEDVHVDATQGGSDQAYFYDTSGDDHFDFWADRASQRGDGYSIQTTGFSTLFATANAGGNDSIDMHDTDGTDLFYGRTTESTLTGAGYQMTARGFETVVAHASGQAGDRAFLYDSAGNDQLEATPTEVRLSGSGVSQAARGFRSVYAIARNGGQDQATFYDSAGNDLFVSTDRYSYMRGADYSNLAYGFSVSSAVSQSGGYDQAVMSGSAGVDRVTVRPDQVVLSGDGYTQSAAGFSRVRVDGRGGSDQAFFFGLGQDDEMYGRGKVAEGRYRESHVQLLSFAYVQAQSKPGETSSSDVVAVDYVFEQTGLFD